MFFYLVWKLKNLQIYSGNYNPPVQTTKPKGGFTQGSSSSFTGPAIFFIALV